LYGDKIQDDLFCNQTVYGIVRAANVSKVRQAPCLGCVNIIYQGTPLGSPARRLMVYFYRYHVPRAQAEQADVRRALRAMPEFLLDFTCAALPVNVPLPGLEENWGVSVLWLK
jgi:hypothetical protein